MITYSIIKKSQLEGAHRLDAEYYHPDKLKALSIIDKLEGEKISEYFMNIRTIFNPEKQELKNKAYIYDLTDALSLLLEEGNEVNSSQEVGSAKKIVKKNDVIISRLRSYLKEIAFIFENGNTKLVSTEFIVLRNKDKEVEPELLFSYLQTDLVQTILQWSQEGTNHPRFSEEVLLNIKIPNKVIAAQDNIKNLICESYQLAKESRIKYSQAEELLLEELGLKDFKVEEDLSYIINLSDIKNAHRADAEYFQPKYKKLKEKIKNHNVKLLGDLVLMKKGFEPGSESYQENGKLFIRVSNISKQGLIEKDQKYIDDELYQRLNKNFEPKVGEILLTKDATPGIAYVLKECVEGIISSGILRLKKNIEPEYLALCINTVIGKMQVEQDSGGSIIEHWKPDQIKKLQIPILPDSIQQQIARLVQQSHEARKKAKELLEEAKQKVEKMIENSK
jgi:restriction endonuclease S subunit